MSKYITCFREYVTTNTIIKEVIESRFTNTYPIDIMLTVMKDMVVKGHFSVSLVFRIMMT